MIKYIRVLIWALSFPRLVVLRVISNANLLFYKKRVKMNRPANDTDNYIYLNTESPAYLAESHYSQFFGATNVESPGAIYKNSTSGKVRRINTTFLYALCDRFCSFKNLSESEIDRIWQLKENQILVLRTGKDFLRGHKLRNDVFESLSPFQDQFVCLDLSEHYVADLADIYWKYKACIVIENAIDKTYVSEKFFDPIKWLCTPIYLGGDTKEFKKVEIKKRELESSEELVEYLQAQMLSGAITKASAKRNYAKLVSLRERYEDQFVTSHLYTYFKSNLVHRRSRLGKFIQRFREK